MIEGQLSFAERRHIARALKEAEPKPKVCLEVGTWLGGGSTLHISGPWRKTEQGTSGESKPTVQFTNACCAI